MSPAPAHVFPAQFGLHWQTTHIVFVAEGFPSGELPTFVRAVDSFWEILRATPPFGLLVNRPSRIRGWSMAQASVDHGAAVGSTPGNTLLGATYDQGSKTLALDPARVSALLSASQLPQPFDLPLTWLARTDGWSPDGLVVVLLPPVAGGQPLTADLDTSIRPVAERPEASPPWLIATTIDLGWERVAIEALARCIGLEDEWSRSEPEFAQPDANSNLAYALQYSPNLFVGTPPAGPPTPDFCWYTELDTVARSKALTVVPAGQLSPTPFEPIQLFEGGARYQTGVYRSANDCFMRRRIGTLQSPRYDSIDFCTLCRRALTRAIADTQPDFRRISIGNQKLMVDQVDNWQKADRATSGFPRVVSYTTRPAGSTGPWWAFDAKVGPQYGGLRIENLLLKEQPADSLASETVAELIEFRDIAVELENGDKTTFDLGEAFNSTQNPPELQLLEAGTLGIDKLFQRGIKLTLHNELGGKCPVEVDLSLTVRGARADIEPSGGIVACKFYPQIALRYLPHSSVKVKRFRACIRIICNNRLRAGSEHVHGGMAGTPDETIASLFADTNGWNGLIWRTRYGSLIGAPGFTRRFEVREGNPILPALGFPLWTFTFDYHKPDLRQDVEFRGVYGPLAPKPELRKGRSTQLKWPSGSTYQFKVQKAPDQGQYDNMHVHASMGDDPFRPGSPMVHAPGCAEACIHIHWRWGIGTEASANLPDGNPPEPFRGWNRSWWGPNGPHTDATAPLIPSNQDLTFAVTNPATNRADPWAPVVPAGAQPAALDPKRKVMWYTVDVSGPVAGENQIVLEMGISFAFQYNLDAWLSKKNLAYLRWLTHPPGAPDTRTDNDLQHLQYSYARWFLRDNPDFSTTVTSEQIPTGTTLSDSGIALQDL